MGPSGSHAAAVGGRIDGDLGAAAVAAMEVPAAAAGAAAGGGAEDHRHTSLDNNGECERESGGYGDLGLGF